MFNIQFNFEPETSKITNLKVIKVDKSKDDAVVSVNNGKLCLTKAAVELLGVTTGDKIAINYWTQDNETTFPLIGKAELFADKDNGNRLTKSNTVSFRGMQEDILLEYGKFFKIEPFNKYFKMVKIEEVVENTNLDEEEQDLSNLK